MTITSSASTLTTINPPMLISISVLCGTHQDSQAIDPHDLAAFAARERFFADVARAPRATAHLRFANAIERYLFHDYRCLTDQSINTIGAVASRGLQEPFAKQPKGEHR